jgi:glycosyltransferase involved in cell wall biosynthesis
MTCDKEEVPPFFSVIMPTYNRQELLDEAVRSVINQLEEDWELIVVDDASPTPVRVAHHPRVHLVRLEENRGFSVAANAGLKYACGSTVAFLADDDAWTTTRLENAKRAHLAGADVVVCRSTVMHSTGMQFGISNAAFSISSPGDVGRAEMLGSLCAISIRRELCPNLNEDMRGSEDIDWSIRLSSLRPLVAHVHSDDFLWRKHSGVRHGNGTEARILASQRLLEVHSEYYGRHPSSKAYRLYRMGHMSLQNGRRLEACRFAGRSLLVRPNGLALRLLARGMIGVRQ